MNPQPRFESWDEAVERLKAQQTTREAQAAATPEPEPAANHGIAPRHRNKRLVVAIFLFAIVIVATGLIVVWRMHRELSGAPRPATIAALPATVPVAPVPTPMRETVPDWSQWEMVRAIPFDGGEATGVAFAPSGNVLAIGGGTHRSDPSERDSNGFQTGLVHLVDLSSGEVKLSITNPTEKFWGIGFYPDGSAVAVGSGVYTKVYNASTGELKFAVHAAADQIAFHPTRKVFAVSFGGSFWDMAAGQPRTAPATSRHEWPAFSPDGKLFYGSGSLWVLETGEKIGQWEPDRAVFSHDSRFLAVPGALWDVHAKIPVWTNPEPVGFNHTRGMAFSPDDRLLMVAGHTGEIRILASASGRAVHRFQANEGIHAIAISPNSRHLATVSPDAGVTLCARRFVRFTGATARRNRLATANAWTGHAQIQVCLESSPVG